MSTRRLRRIGPFAIACFLAAAGVPRQPFYAHRHAGGDAPHVHLDLLWAHFHHDHHGHAAADHHHDYEVELANLDDQSLARVASEQTRDHVHWQQPFQAAATPRTACVRPPEPVAFPAARLAEQPPADKRCAPRSRGPPETPVA